MMAIAEVLAGDFHIPPGERHYFTHVSENREEASKTLGVLERYLRILGVGHTRSGDTIELEGLPRGFKVLAARVGAVSGWRCLGWTADEAAKWNNEGADPTGEIIVSMDAMTVTHPEVRRRLFSSPLGMMGYFYELWSAGDTADVVTGRAASWEANPSITREHTIKLARGDMRIHRREYEALAQAGLLATFDMGAADRAFEKSIEGTTPGVSALIVDPSSGGADAFTYCLARWHWPPSSSRFQTYVTHVAGQRVVSYVNDADGKRVENPGWTPSMASPFLRFDHIGAFEGGFWGKLGGAEIVSRIASQLCKPNGVTWAYGDQRERLMLTAQFAQHGIRYVPIDWTGTSKPLAVERVRGWLRDDAISLEKNDKLRAELASFEEKILPSGQLSFSARRGGHDDRVALLITAAHAEAEGGIPASPAFQSRRDYSRLPIA
jgi:hypothetical protein